VGGHGEMGTKRKSGAMEGRNAVE